MNEILWVKEIDTKGPANKIKFLKIPLGNISLCIVGRKENKFCRIESDLIYLSPEYDSGIKKIGEKIIESIKLILYNNHILLNPKQHNISRRFITLKRIPTNIADKIANDILSYYSSITTINK